MGSSSFTSSVSRSTLGLICLAGALGLAAGNSGAAPPQEAPRDCNPATDDPLHGGLPFFDIRLDKDEVPTAAVRAALDAALRPGAAARSVEANSLLGRIPLLTIDSSQFYGTPCYVRSTFTFLTDPAPGVDAKTVARDFIAAYPALFEIDAGELAAARVPRDAVTAHNGVRSMSFQQQIKGVDLFECEVRANVMPDGRLLNIGSTMQPRPAGDFVVAAPRLTDLDAIRFAAASSGVAYTQLITPKTDPEGPTQKRTWNNTSDFRADEPIVTELVYFAAARGDIRTAWSVVIAVKGVGHTYDLIIDASSGQLLRRADRLVWDVTPMTFRVFSSDGVAPGSPGRATPDGFQFPEVPRTLLTVQPADISTMDPDGWIATGANDTEGNNVDAHLDLNADNVPDLPRPNGGATRTFDFFFDSTQAPTAWRDFAVTELFWRGNWYHDRLYELGFTEGFHNFQNNNFGRGGVGNDAVQADAQDGSGTNNANFQATGTDGTTGRCQMYVFTGPTPDRDGDLDGDIVYHEFTHGTSIRLHNGLSGTQPQGMGEGWSDFYGVVLQAEPGDDPNANYCVGGYTTYLFSTGFVNNYYFGIRRFPYSVNMNIYPLTYGDVQTLTYDTSIPANPIFINSSSSEVHNVGEIWCNMLLDGRAQLWNTYGFPGNQRMLQLVTDGMKLQTNPNPNFVQSRDSILQADLADYANADRVALWQAFARHGVGSSAVSLGNGGTGITEAFDTPHFITFTYPDGVPATLQPGVATTFHVNMAPVDLTITPGTATLHYSVNGGAASTAPMALVGTNQYTATIPGQACYSDLTFYITVGTSSGTQSDPATAPASTYAATNTTTLWADDMETDRGWTVSPGTPPATTGIWNRMPPQATQGPTGLAQPGSDHTPGTGVNCWVTDGNAGAGLGANDVDNGQTILTTPAINLAGAPASTVVSYWRWYTNDQGVNPNQNRFLVDVSVNNGDSWTRAETVGPMSPGSQWILGSWTFAQFGLTPSAQVKVRFTAQDLSPAPGAIVEAAIDDVRIYACPAPTPPPTCDSADFNCDGDTGTDADIEAFFACIAGTCPTPPCMNSADFNHDGDSGTDADIEAFFRVLGGGNC
jgi:hypothetical protein